MRDFHDIFDGSSSSDSSLGDAEKRDAWGAIRSHMAAHPAPTSLSAEEEAFAQAFFEPATLEGLTAEERLEAFGAIGRERDAATFFASAKEEALSAEERTGVLHSLRDEATVVSLFSAAEDVHLGELERAAILSHIQGSMASPSAIEARRPREGALTAARRFLTPSWLVPGLALLLVAAGGAGITYAADDALPGEFLYPIKKVQERISAGLQFSAESRAEAETARVGKRLKEAESLHAAKRLTEDLSASLDQEFRQERREAIKHIQRLETAGNAEAAARVRARLNAYEDGYKKLFVGKGASVEVRSTSSYPTVRVEINGKSVATGSDVAAQSSSSSAGSDASSSSSSRRSRRQSSSSAPSSMETSVRVETSASVSGGSATRVRSVIRSTTNVRVRNGSTITSSSDANP